MVIFDSDKIGEEKAALVSTLSQAIAGKTDYLKLARSLASTLRDTPLDWRDLARALDVARAKLADTANPQRAAQLLDRVAILAMRLSENDTPKASADVFKACASETEPEQMLQKVAAILQTHIPFEVIGYTEYCHGSGTPGQPAFIQSRFALDGDQPFSWPARWIAIPPALVAWAEGACHFVSDIDAFYTEQPEARALRNHVVSQEYAKRGITSFLFAPCMDGGRIRSALTLGRRRNGPYSPFGQYDQQRLDALRLELVLRQIGEAYARRAASLEQELVELFTPEAVPAELANTLVTKLADGYGLEYVGLFRINRVRGRFEVIAQHDGHGALKVSSDYSQGVEEGMLGHVLRQGHELYAENLRTTPPPYDYRAAIDAQASAICFPIRLGRGRDAEVEWIIDLESSQIDAFPRPEQITLKKIVTEVERAVQLWFEARLCAGLLNVVDQGVVVLGQKMRIERANLAARRLLGLPREAKLPSHDQYVHLEDFAADDSTRQLISVGHASSAGAHLRLRGPDDVVRHVLAGSSYRDEAFNRRVWLLGDLEQQEWVGNLHYMEAAVRTVSAQTHGNLRLAGALLQKARSELDPGSPACALLDRAIRSIAIADLPYERITSVHDVIAAPKRLDSVLNLSAVLRQFRESLSPDDVTKVELEFPELVVVKADPERLAFALRSLLGYLLALRLPGAELHVRLSTSQTEARVDVDIEGVPPEVVAKIGMVPDNLASAHDKIAYAEALAVAAAAHGLEAVQKVVEAHGGELHQAIGDHRQVRFTISKLPLDSAERPRRSRAAANPGRSEGRAS